MVRLAATTTATLATTILSGFATAVATEVDLFLEAFQHQYLKNLFTAGVEEVVTNFVAGMVIDVPSRHRTKVSSLYQESEIDR